MLWSYSHFYNTALSWITNLIVFNKCLLTNFHCAFSVKDPTVCNLLIYRICDKEFYFFKQFYKIITDECKVKPKPLNPGQTVFYMVQPRFMNVDIRILVDVTQGALDLFLSPRDDTFVVKINSTNSFQEVKIHFSKNHNLINCIHFEFIKLLIIFSQQSY